MLKTIFYDWGGFNRSLFDAINQCCSGSAYDQAMLLLTEFGNRQLFIYWLLLVASIGVLNWCIHRLRGEVVRLYSLRLCLSVIMMMVIGYGLNIAIAGGLKSYLAMPRPFVALGLDQVRVIGRIMEESEFHRSFPSGHAAFITLMVASLWPMINAWFKALGILLILGVMWSRMAMGVHYPVDVVGGVLIGIVTARIAWAIVRRLIIARRSVDGA